MAKSKAVAPKSGSPVAHNRKARFNFTIEDSIECGISLLGSEVKSLRLGQANLDEAFARIHDGEVWLYNMHIGPYEQATLVQHDPRRTRKLLLHRREIERFLDRAMTRGYTLVPLELFWKRGNAKIRLAIAKGKRQFDKREAIKNRDVERDTRREMSRRRRG
jgi:SsrA-binding protein